MTETRLHAFPGDPISNTLVERHRRRNAQFVLIGDGKRGLDSVGPCGVETENEARESFHDVIQSLE